MRTAIKIVVQFGNYFEETTQNISDEVLHKLPTDSAAQHDHYLYGTPKIK